MEHDRALEGEVHRMREKVEDLMASYQLVESSGHRELNQLRGVASSLEWKWNQFENDMEQRQKNLQSSLRFQDNLFKVEGGEREGREGGREGREEGKEEGREKGRE